MASTDKTKQFLAEFKAKREAATPGEWSVQQKGLSSSPDPYVFDSTYGSTLHAYNGPSRQENCEFTAFAANNTHKIIEACEVMLEALGRVSVQNSQLAYRTLEQVEQILSDRGEL